MRHLTDQELQEIEQHVALYLDGDYDALRPEDLAAMLTEIDEDRRQIRHLIALQHQQGRR